MRAPGLAVPAAVRLQDPGQRLVVVAPRLAAGVRRADVGGEVRPGAAEAVVRPPVDDHVGLLGHVALDAQRPVRWPAVNYLLVEVVVGRVVDLALVALQAEGVALPQQFELWLSWQSLQRDAPRVHLALQERPVDVDLVQVLAVRVVEPLRQQ